VRIERILVPTDFSENAQVALEAGYDLARQLGARVYVLHVQDETTLRTAVKEGLLRPDSTDQELESEVAEMIEQRLSISIAGLGSDVTVERVSRRGDPKVVVVEYAREIDADLVVVGMRGTSAMEHVVAAVLGSVAERVTRRSPCPTLVVRLDHRK
jgi:nucleotide-binding universal stress UspA family protein